jgi:hypothetical protein
VDSSPLPSAKDRLLLVGAVCVADAGRAQWTAIRRGEVGHSCRKHEQFATVLSVPLRSNPLTLLSQGTPPLGTIHFNTLRIRLKSVSLSIASCGGGERRLRHFDVLLAAIQDLERLSIAVLVAGEIAGT